MRVICPNCGYEFEANGPSIDYVNLNDGNVYLNITCPNCGVDVAVNENDGNTLLEADTSLIPLGMILDN